MRFLGFIATAVLIAGCWLREDSFDWRWKTSYYDRNGDGIVDFEFHHMKEGADTDWALIDTQFSGRYDFRVHWGRGFETKQVSMPVPRLVKITPGQPPVSFPENFSRLMRPATPAAHR